MASENILGQITLPDPETQVVFEQLLSEAGKRFPGVKFQTKVVSKHLIGEEILIALSIQTGAMALYDVIKWVHGKLSDKKLKLDLNYESRITLAESMLEKNGVTPRKLVKRVDHLSESSYIFVGGEMKRHCVVVHSDGGCDYEVEG